MPVDDERTAPGAETRLNLQLVSEIGQAVLVEPRAGDGCARPTLGRTPGYRPPGLPFELRTA